MPMPLCLWGRAAWRLAAGLTVWAACGVLAAQTLPEVVVRAQGADAAWRSRTAPTTIIRKEDIARSPARSVAELLAQRGNLNLQSYFGNDRNATLDIRGMGATASSNVLVVVDGVRINANDLSGSDLSTLSLDQVERIEIERGGGSVSEGNGAVGGVVRITTRKALPEGGQSAHAQVLVGSQGRHEAQAQGGLRRGVSEVSAQLRQAESDGHRDNGHLDQQGGGLTLRLSPRLGAALGAPHAQMHLQLDTHTSRYGLPGPVSAAAFAGSDAQRQATRSPLDGGRSTTHHAQVGASLDWGGAGQLSWHSDYRKRDNPYLIGADAARPLADQQNQIVSAQWTHRVRHTVQLPFLAEPTLAGSAPTSPPELSLTWDAMDASYERTENGTDRPGATRLLGQADSQAWAIEATWAPTQGMSVNTGWRHERFRSDQGRLAYGNECTYVRIPFPVLVGCTPYAYRPTGADRHGDWQHQAAQAAVGWQLAPAWQARLSLARHVRAPNVDELLLADTTLRPQHGHTGQFSLRHSPQAAWHIEATWFASDTTDEIYYGTDAQGVSSVNRNRAGTSRRRGIELEGAWQPTRQWSVQGQLSYLVPQADGQAGDIPLVPRMLASMSLDWTPSAHWAWALQGRLVGGRRDGNDTQATPYPRLPAYQVWDTGLSYRQGAARIKLGVQNLLDETYSTVAYSQTYYPMPPRQAYLSLDWTP